MVHPSATQRSVWEQTGSSSQVVDRGAVSSTLVASPAVWPLAPVLAAIGRDSRNAPRQYLDEVVVPHGGE
jgi:hypothetical protein